MSEAEVCLARATTTAVSPWLSPFDAASLANELARCHLLLGDYREADRQARAVLEERPPDRNRSRAFAGIARSHALLALGDLDEARSAAALAVEEAGPLHSVPIERELAALSSALDLPVD